jgi:NAD(P)-dependent dehydrogenase (short-subunit alcohol dehydrogenase family)
MAMDGSTIIHDATSGAWASVWYAGKRVLVTGGTSGIGAGLARGFIEAGAHVTVAGVGDAEIAAAAADPLLSKARAHKLDVRDGDAIKSLVNSLDGLDVVVNCAGVIRRGDELEPDVFESVVDINLNGTMRVCSAARPLLAKTNGAIVNLASMLSFFGGGLVPGYAASKAASRSSPSRWPSPMRATASASTPSHPAGSRHPSPRMQADPARSQPILSRTPLGRWGTPSDLLGGVLYLCSPPHPS